MAEVTIMVLKVDLACDKCYRKIKKLLCRYPEIRDQTYFEKEDTVIIKVVCCSPERIRQKLICKGGKTIKSIEIRVPEKPKPPAPEKPKEADKPKPPPEKPKEAEKPKPPPEKPKEAEKPKPPPEKPKEADKPKPPPEKPKEAEKPKPPPEKPKEAEKPKPPPEKPKEAEKPKPADPPKADIPVAKAPPPAPVEPAPAPVNGYPQIFPVAVCCKPCYEVGYGGPCQHGYGTGIPYQPPSSYDGYVRLVPSYEGPAGGGWTSSGCHCNRSYGCRCEYFTEENPSCTIM